MSVIILIEAACFIIALVSLIKDANWAWRSMVFFMLITYLTEITGKLLRTGHHSNQWLYNVFLLFEAGFTSFMSKQIYQQQAIVYRRIGSVAGDIPV
jgi:carbon starvation protein CstA